MTFSDREVLREMDFEKMSNAEIAAGEAGDRSAWPAAGRSWRRGASGADPRGARVDMRATLRAQLRSGASSR